MVQRVPVRIRGVDYPSISDAARALGLTPAAISFALDRGTIDTVGLPVPRGAPRCCRVNGVRYGTLTAAARANGVTVAAIHHALRRGTAHCVGVGRRRADG